MRLVIEIDTERTPQFTGSIFLAPRPKQAFSCIGTQGIDPDGSAGEIEQLQSLRRLYAKMKETYLKFGVAAAKSENSAES